MKNPIPDVFWHHRDWDADNPAERDSFVTRRMIRYLLFFAFSLAALVFFTAVHEWAFVIFPALWIAGACLCFAISAAEDDAKEYARKQARVRQGRRWQSEPLGPTLIDVDGKEIV